MASQEQSSEQGEQPEAAAPAGPRIEVLGDASPEQVAALVAVLSGLGGGEEEAPAGPPSRWSSPERLVRPAVHPSRGGWAASALPR
ncbi:acyl-CoA carboxylase subunit epsilon [Janibacter sp. G349]|jgi:hypothetical protein|uniref:acyl-CoA carboxylase subunit epsilon n=1 Tax=unclassified Janibacter TaxID=2649294 RepID=UPI0020CBDA68|nr:acyl-CoA carboxylase subunit epsilon [Janibacter sp. CX7]UTT65317.1 acyl-CoA carboxylase subunit epsilon [Janibacter sp. CX7]